MNSPDREEPTSIAHLTELIRALPRVVVRGGASKLALTPASPPSVVLSVRRLHGITAFHPLDFTITALAGTPLSEIVSILAERGQCLPFDPPCLSPEATIGGCVSASLEGPAAFRWRGLRHHLLSLQFIDGTGQILRSGARVLKNSAGLDLTSFLAGSLGRFAAFTEVTLRTQRLPEDTATIAWPCTSLERAAALLRDLSSAPWDFDALDLETGETETPLHVVLARISGRASAVNQRSRRIVQTSIHPAFCLSPEEAAVRWHRRTHLEWVPPRSALIKVPLPLSALPAFDAACASVEAQRTYTAGGHLAWVALPAPALIESALHELGLKGLLLLGPSTFTGSPFLGKWSPSPLMRRIKLLFDPGSKFLPWPEAESS